MGRIRDVLEFQGCHDDCAAPEGVYFFQAWSAFDIELSAKLFRSFVCLYADGLAQTVHGRRFGRD
jgi:hypothetical protein